MPAAFEFQKQQLLKHGWTELPGSYATEEAAGGQFTGGGFTVSVSVFAGSEPGKVNVSLLNHGNVALDKLPVPEGAKPFFAGPVSRMLITEKPLSETAAEVRKLLVDAGWEPHGTAGDQAFFKRDGVRLSANVMSAPAQGGKTMIDYSSLLMSADLPAPPNAVGVQYADSNKQLGFDSPDPPAAVVDWARKKLGEAGWKATTDNPVQSDFKHWLIFRNPTMDLLNFEYIEVDGKTRVMLRFQTAAEVEELDRKYKAEIERRKQEQDKPLPRLKLTLPAGAKEVNHSASRLDFSVPQGQARAVIDLWRQELKGAGWKEEAKELTPTVGSISFKLDGQTLTVNYHDTGVVAAGITAQALGMTLEKPAN